MRIVYCTPAIYNSAGTERVLALKANYLARECGYDVTIVTTDQRGRKPYFDFDGSIGLIDCRLNFDEDVNRPLAIRIFLHFRKMSRYRRLLDGILSRIQPDICVSLGGKEIGFLTKLRDGSKKIAETHFSQNAPYLFFTFRHKSLLWKLIGRMRTGSFIAGTRHLDKLVVLTKQDERQWQKTNGNVMQIYNPVATVCTGRASLDAKRFISVGRLSPQKGYDMLIDAWARVHPKHPDWTLDIFGEGELREELQQWIDGNGLQGCVSLRGVSGRIMEEYIGSSGYLMSSRWEGFPMVLLEASSAGLPLISFDCECGPQDMITDGFNGCLIPNGDIEKLSEAISLLIENPEKRKQMGANAAVRSQDFLPEKILPRWRELFESLAAAKDAVRSEAGHTSF